MGTVTYLILTYKKTLPALTTDRALSGPSIRSIRRGNAAVGNIIMSRRNRPVVNTDIMRGNGTGGNAIASLSNGCVLRLGGDGTPIMISCVKCGDMAVIGNNGIALRTSGGLLSRLIIMNCNARGGTALANSMSSVNDSRLDGVTTAGVAGTLTNGATNMVTGAHANRPNTSSTGVLVHNGNAVNSASPLVMMSNITSHSFNHLGPSSVRDVSMLGSTSTTVCNTHTTGNIVLIAAGHNGTNGIRIGCSNAMSFSRPAHVPGVLGTCRCTACAGRFSGGQNTTLACPRRTLRGVGSNSSRVDFPSAG